MRLLDLFGRVRLGVCRLGDVPQQKSTGRVADQNVMDGMGWTGKSTGDGCSAWSPACTVVAFGAAGPLSWPARAPFRRSPSRGPGSVCLLSIHHTSIQQDSGAAHTLPCPILSTRLLAGVWECERRNTKGDYSAARLLDSSLFDCSRGCEIRIDERDMASGNGSWPVTVSDMEHDRRKWAFGSGQLGGHGSSTGTSRGKALTCAGRRHSKTMTDGR